ncbi:condensation domain-containing protein [Micromonospora sp. NBC_01740]|uniref:condensation domain-containing protein n=1 Tax=Micromonospora sp. NBC_01740 TaxID=2975986 RepID=UPI002E1024FA|nr:condensation domain-containing protein [Micromonospora sp. NBC_01740]
MRDHFETSEHQEYLCRLDGRVGPATLMTQVCHRLNGDVDVEALRRAVGRLAEAHPLLRRAFAEHDGYVVLRDGRDRADLEVVEVPDDRAALDWCQAALRRPVDLWAGPCWTVSLARTGTGSSYLLLCAHMALLDHHSLDLLVDDLAVLYGAELGAGTGQPPAAEPIDDVLDRLFELGEEQAEEDLDWWLDTFGRLGPVETGADLTDPFDAAPDGPPPAPGGHLAQAHVPSGGIVPAVRRLRVSPFAAYTAALLGALGGPAATRSFRVAFVVDMRSFLDCERVVGQLSQAAVLRVDVPPGIGFADLSRRVAHQAAESLGHQAVPFERVVVELKRRGVPVHLLAPVSVNYSLLRAIDWPGATAEAIELDSTSALDDTAGLGGYFDQLDGQEQLRIKLYAAASSYSAGRTDELLAETRRCLEIGLASPDQPLAAGTPTA